MKLFEKIEEYAHELSELKELLSKYDISIPYRTMFFKGWFVTFDSIIQQFDSSSYDELFKSEADKLEKALRILKTLPLKHYNKHRVEQVFKNNEVPPRYYSSILDKVFDP